MSLTFRKEQFLYAGVLIEKINAISADGTHILTSSIPGIIFHYVNGDLVFVGERVINTVEEIKASFQHLYDSWDKTYDSFHS